MNKMLQGVALCLAAAAAHPTWARTPLTDAAQALIDQKPALRFVTYGDTDLAPVNIFRDKSRTYIHLGRDTSQRVDAMEVTEIGYRRLPSSYDPPYLIVSGFAPSLALSYPGRRLVFIEFTPEAIQQPASSAELAIRMRERAGALLSQQTRLETAEREVLARARTERERADLSVQQAQATLAQAQQAQRDADARQAAVAQQQAKVNADAEAVSKRAQKAFAVYRNDGRLRAVLTRWARNEGMDLEWGAPDDDRFNPQVAGDGNVDALDLKEAMRKLLSAFHSTQVHLQATFYSNGIIEITNTQRGTR